jgi:hypothetical protein
MENKNYNSLKALVEALETDYTKFNTRKIKVCGNRVRNNLLNIKKLCDSLRKEIQVELNSLPTKHRIKNIKMEVKDDEVKNVDVNVEEVKEFEEELPPLPTELVRQNAEVKPKKPKTKRKRKST